MEKLLHYIWQHKLWQHNSLYTNDNRKVQVIDSGLPNTNSGPDFFNAKVKIGNEMWIGNVEIHTRASDWFRHNHQFDKAYDSVILHVVEKDDCEVRRINGNLIPQCSIKVAAEFYDNFTRLTKGTSAISCSDKLSQISSLHINSWIDNLAFERIIAKSQRIMSLLDVYSGSWEDVCYVTLGRSLGFGINNDAFERLTRITPLNLIGKISDSLFQIEALLFGQAGLLMPIPDDSSHYYNHLCSEYAYLSHRFSLKPMDGTTWKFFRTRPQNFPIRRIALLAKLLFGGFKMINRLTDIDSLKSLRELINVPLDGFWANHYNFNLECNGSTCALSNAATDVIIINTVVPLLYAYGEFFDIKEYSNRAINFLEDMKPESNSIISQFAEAGIKAHNAFESQALIQLRREYCEPRKCIYCRIGHQIMSSSISGNAKKPTSLEII